MKVKALVLLSGGLDSRLAARILQEQADVVLLYFDLPFGAGCCRPDCAFNFSQVVGMPLKIIDCTKGKLFYEYLQLVRKPKHGYGSALNPCVDCRIFMLKKAKKIAKKINADIIVTGEVLNERPLSQTKDKLLLIEKEAGLRGKLLRPLSAKLLPETEAEKNKLIKREKLFGISGRSRRPQLELAKKFNISFPSPAGGCLLCEKEFAKKLIDLFGKKNFGKKKKKKIVPEDIKLLKIGRHFRFGNTKIIVGRNEKENKMLAKLAKKSDLLFQAKNYGSPTTLLKGEKTKKAIRLAASLTARYSDAPSLQVDVAYGYGKKRKFDNIIKIGKASQKIIEKLRI